VQISGTGSLFNKKTVFVLGAGASAECGMPIGNVLKEQIGESVRFPRDGDYNFGQICSRWKHYATFRVAGRELAETLSTFPSMDEALHWWRHRNEIVELGKLAIAYFILRAER
jgi:hypothetical protein